MPTETRCEVSVKVSGFVVTSPEPEHDELRDLLSEAASEIASDIGMALASLGTSCIGGTVAVYCDGVKGQSDDAD